MGKGNRNDQKQVAKKINSAKVGNRGNKKNGGGKAVAAACIAFALVITAILVINVLTETGVFIRLDTAVELGDVKVDSAMMTFFYNDYVMTFQNNYGSYASMMGVNFSADLRSQTFPKDGLASYFLGETYDGTWYDYFLDKVVDNVEMYVALCDAANKEGIKLDDEDMATIDERVNAIKESLKSTGTKISNWYGKGVNESDVRRCYELITLASKYSEHKYEALEAALEKEDGTAIDKYIEENKSNFYSAEYLSYDIVVSGKNLTDEAYAAKIAQAKQDAEKIANAGNVEAFLELVKQYEIDNDITKATETKKETETTETETGTETVDIEEEADDYRHTINYETSTGGVGEWIFKEEASEGDGKVFTAEKTETVKAETTAKTESKTETTSGTGSESESGTKAETTKPSTDKKTYKVTTVTAYLVTKASHLDKTLTNNIAFVIGDNRKDIEAVQNKFSAGTDKSLDAFNKIAEEYYENLHKGHDHSSSTAKEPVFVYNKVEQASKDYFKSNYFGKENEADEWLAMDIKDDSLSVIIKVEVDKNTYYALVFFDSHAEEQYYVNAFNGVVNERFDNWYEKESGKKNIEYDQRALDNINVVLY